MKKAVEFPRLSKTYLNAYVENGIYITGEPVRRAPNFDTSQVTGAEYAKFTKNFTRSSADLIIYSWLKNRLYVLGINRKRKPMKGAWFAGGRRYALESWIEAVIRYAGNDMFLFEFISEEFFLSKVKCLPGAYGGPWDL